jgi:hypothetical protein
VLKTNWDRLALSPLAFQMGLKKSGNTTKDIKKTLFRKKNIFFWRKK